MVYAFSFLPWLTPHVSCHLQSSCVASSPSPLSCAWCHPQRDASCSVIKMFMADVCCHKLRAWLPLPLRFSRKKVTMASGGILLAAPATARTAPATGRATLPFDYEPYSLLPPSLLLTEPVLVFIALYLLITLAVNAFRLWRNAPKGRKGTTNSCSCCVCTCPPPPLVSLFLLSWGGV